MKKTVIALAIAAMAATSANAATVYDKDGTKVEVNGSLRLYLGKTFSGFDGGKRGDLINDGSRLIINAEQKITDDVKAFVGYQLRFENTKDGATASNQAKTDTNWGGVQTRDLFVGLDFTNVGKVSFGRQTTNGDDVLGDNLYYKTAGLNPIVDHADKSIKFTSADFGGFTFGADYLFGDDDKTSGNYKNGYQLTGIYAYKLGEGHSGDVALTYGVDQIGQANSSVTAQKDTTWAVGTHYDVAGLHFGVAYGQKTEKHKFSPADNTKAHYVFVETTYDLKDVVGIPSTIGVQWERLSSKKVNKPNADRNVQNRLATAIDYKFNKNLMTYAQVVRATEKEGADRQSETIYGVGLRVGF